MDADEGLAGVVDLAGVDVDVDVDEDGAPWKDVGGDLAGVRVGGRVLAVLGLPDAVLEGVLGVRATEPTLDCRAGVGLGTGTAVSTGGGAGSATTAASGGATTKSSRAGGGNLVDPSARDTMSSVMLEFDTPLAGFGLGGHSRFSLSSSLAESPVCWDRTLLVRDGVVGTTD